MNDPDVDIQATTAAEFARLTEILEGQTAAAWETPSLCDGWRVREVVAHMTMPARYSQSEFIAELNACGGDFGVLSDTVATRDANLPIGTLLDNLRSDVMRGWTPPGGGPRGALTHVVIHGLDITAPLGIERSPDAAIVAILEHLTVDGVHAHFGFVIDGLRLQATDTDWGFGTGRLVTGTAADLALHICGREAGSIREA